MTDKAAIAYMHDTMQKKGIKDYIWDVLPVSGEAGEAVSGYFFIKATNQLLILIDEEKYYGLLVVSENGVFNSNDPTQTVMSEHTGKIEFTRIGSNWNLSIDPLLGLTIPVKFLRVIF